MSNAKSCAYSSVYWDDCLCFVVDNSRKNKTVSILKLCHKCSQVFVSGLKIVVENGNIPLFEWFRFFLLKENTEIFSQYLCDIRVKVISIN